MKIIAIASAKGGVGKSTVCANLAYRFSKEHSVGILDADIYGPNQHIYFNVVNQKPEVIEVDGKKAFIPVPVSGLVLNSMGFILDSDKAAMWRGPMLSGAIKQLMTSTQWGNLEFLFIDMPPGTGDAYLTVAAEIKPDGAVLVSSSSPLAINDTIKSKAVFNRLNIPIYGYIDNLSYSICSKCREELYEELPLGEFDTLELPKLGSIPRCREIATFDLDASSPFFDNAYNNLQNALLNT